jgi:hypothetical protein
MKARVKRVKKMGKDRPNRELRRRGAVRFKDLQPAIVESDTPLSVGCEVVKTDTIGKRPRRKVRPERVLAAGEAALHMPRDLQGIDERRARKDPKYRGVVEQVMDSAKARLVGSDEYESEFLRAKIRRDELRHGPLEIDIGGGTDIDPEGRTGD